jgi:hypothetical protein
LSPTPELAAAVDAPLQDWRQGDVLLAGDVPFAYLADYDRPITPQSEEAAAANERTGDDPLGIVSISVPDLAILTQTCDLIRSCSERPLVRVAALVRLTPDILDQVKRGYRPRLAFIPGIAEQGLAADLDSVMTVEKAIIAVVPPNKRVRGCRDDLEVREFALALSRNASRTAFPDDFVSALRQVQRRIQEKHGKNTHEGKLLAALREIRVSCVPSWDAADASLTFLFIFNERQDIPADGDEIVAGLLTRFQATGPFVDPSFRLVAINEMSAAAYLSSDPLDLDHLSHV